MSAVGAVFASPATLLAQETDVIRAADDAFGQRIGVEQIGLYSEGNVRGFSLEDAGNYRIQGSYFVRAAAPANAVVTGTTTRVGVNALRYDLPTPSGVVDYALRRGPEGSRLLVETGKRANSGSFAELFLDHQPPAGRLSLSAGVQLYPWQLYADGARGDFFSVGFVPRWKPGGAVEVTGIATWTSWDRDSDVGHAVTGPFLPPRIERRSYRGQPWTHARNTTGVLGAIADTKLGEDWNLRASLFEARDREDAADFNLYRVNDAGGAADAFAFLVPRQSTRALSGEAALSYAWGSGRAAHRLLAIARLRDSGALIARSSTVPLGPTDLLGPAPRMAAPERPAASGRVRDDVGQWTLGAAYRLAIGDDVELRAELQKTRYRKSISARDLARSSNITAPLLYGGSVAVGLARATTAFASYTRGLEESGVAPANAANRNEVLPAVLASQSELGLKQGLGRGLTLIGSLFRIGKPVPGLMADGRFDLVGRARHQGFELSIAGALTEGLNVVAGATYLHARVTEPDSGPRRAVGRPDWQTQANVTWRVPGAERLSIDGSLTYTGAEAVNRAGTLRTRPFTVVNAGLRYAFSHSRVPFTLRARVTNLFNTFAWTATPSELLFYNAPRSFALSLAAEL